MQNAVSEKHHAMSQRRLAANTLFRIAAISLTLTIPVAQVLLFLIRASLQARRAGPLLALSAEDHTA
jgi:hypothetical protein